MRARYWALASMTLASTVVITGMVGMPHHQSSLDKVNACVKQAWAQQDLPGVAPRCKGLTPAEDVQARQLLVSYVMLGGK